MLAIKRSVVVAPEVNLTNPLQASNEAHKRGTHCGFEIQMQMSPKVQNRGISGLTKKTDVIKKV